MKKIILILSLFSFNALVLSGCVGSSGIVVPSIKTTEKFRVNSISVKVVQKVTPDIKYHTEAEIKEKVVEGIKKTLNEAGLLSINKNMTSLDISMTYYKKFVGEDTALPSDSLAYPKFDYEIIVKDGEKILATISRKNQVYSGGLIMNLQLMSGMLRDKSDELPFIEALHHTVVEYIKALKN